MHRATTDNLFEVQDHDLLESLKREVVVKTGNWNNDNNNIVSTYLTEEQMRGDYQQPRLFSLSFPDVLANQSNFIKNKLVNIAYMRADVVVTLKVQATPFVQGSLFLYQNPYASRTTPTRNTLNEHLRSLTSFPGVELNLQSLDRSVVMHLPYTSEYQVINPRSDEELTSVECVVLMPLTSSETVVKASYVVLARLVNIKLYGHSPTNVEGDDFDAGRILTQSSRGEDLKATNKGTISSVSSTISSVAGALGDVPVIGSIAKPISWVANAVSGVASLFGYSRPHNLKSTKTFANVPGRSYTNVEGLDNSIVLGCYADNSIDSTKATYDGIDEMHIQYLADRPYVFNRYVWTDKETHGNIIANVPLSPCNPHTYAVTRFGQSTFFGAPISLATSLFKWWRGRPVMKIVFAKTQYHQGRLLVQYLPYGRQPAPTEEVLSWIVDLSQVGPEGFEFEPPFVIRNKWLRTIDAQDSVKGYDFDACGGTVVISVLSSLINAPTVSDSVQFCLWMHWKDFQVAELGTNLKIASSLSYTSQTPRKVWLTSEDIVTVISPTYVMALGVTDTPFSITFAHAELGTIKAFEWSEGEITTNVVPPGTYAVVNGLEGRTIICDGAIEVKPGDTVRDTYPVEISDRIPFLSHTRSYILPFVKGSITGGDDAKIMIEGIKPNSILEFGKRYFFGSIFVPPNLRTQIVLSDLDTFTGNFYSTGVNTLDPILTQSSYSEGDSSSLDTTMGETIVSLRAATRRFTLARKATGTGVVLDTLPLTELTTLRQSYVDIISYMYRFVAGSIRYKIFTRGLQLVMLHSNDREENIPGRDFLDTNAPSHIQNCDLNPFLEVEMPFYSPAESLVMNSSTFTEAHSSLSQISVSSMEGAKHTYFCLKAAGDDMNFSFLVGAPAFIVGPRFVDD